MVRSDNLRFWEIPYLDSVPDKEISPPTSVGGVGQRKSTGSSTEISHVINSSYWPVTNRFISIGYQTATIILFVSVPQPHEAVDYQEMPYCQV